MCRHDSGGGAVSAPATQAFLLLVIATVYEGLFRAKGAKSSGIDQETLLNWTYRFNKESLEGHCQRKVARTEFSTDDRN